VLGLAAAKKTCKSSGGKCTAKDGKEMMLKDNGKDRCMQGAEGGGEVDKCSEESFNDHCCAEKTCEMEKCQLAGKAAGHEAPGGDDPFDAYCGTKLQIDGQNPCKTKCELGKESTKEELMACAVCSNKNNPKAKWCHSCLQCKAKHYLGMTLDDLTKPEDTTKTPTKTQPKDKKQPKATNPEKPAFVAADFSMDEYVVVADVSKVTLAPTKSPTPPPTKKGQTVETKQVEKKAVTTTIPFPFTADEAKSPAVQKSVSDGTADALGMERKFVKISKIGGVAVGRRLADSISFEFQIISNDASPAAMTKLAENVKAAASEGSIVANIQKQAAANGVITAALKSMTREVTVTTTESTATVTVTVVVTPTPEPTVLNGATAVSISQSCMMLALVQVGVFALL